jgi:hypothetical protein
MMIPNLALSIRQPFVEQILRGTKRIKYRSVPTRIRGRVLIYSSLRPRHDLPSDWKRLGKQPEELPLGVIVGSVEIWGCRGKRGDYKWLLRKPRRLRTPWKPRKHPQPVWFHPK